MTWSIHVPHRSRADALVDVGAAATALRQDEDRAIVRQIVLDATVGGWASSAGELLDYVERAEPSRRREILDTARSQCGLPTATELDAQAELEAHRVASLRALRGKLERDQNGCALQSCAVCGTTPVDEATGAPRRTRERRWHCDQHRSEAKPEDLQPWAPRLGYNQSGAFCFLPDPAELERERDAERARARAREARRAERQAEVAAHSRHREAMAETYTPRGPAWGT